MLPLVVYINQLLADLPQNPKGSQSAVDPAEVPPLEVDLSGQYELTLPFIVQPMFS